MELNGLIAGEIYQNRNPSTIGLDDMVFCFELLVLSVFVVYKDDLNDF